MHRMTELDYCPTPADVAEARLREFADRCGITILTRPREAIAGGSKGMSLAKLDLIVLAKDLDATKRVGVLAHELTHMLDPTSRVPGADHNEDAPMMAELVITEVTGNPLPGDDVMTPEDYIPWKVIVDQAGYVSASTICRLYRAVCP